MGKDLRSEGDPVQVAIVTGASEGIGRAIALALARSGRKVHAVSRSREKLDRLLADNPGQKDPLQIHPADATDPSQVQQLIREILEQDRRIDILVNNVGQGLKRELIDTSDEEWNHLVRINLSSAFYTCRAVLPAMREQGRGWIVNIASRAGRRGEGQFAAYSAMKHGVVGLTRALADSESRYQIRVNAICPGAVSTEKMLARYPGQDPAGWVAPDEVARAVLFLVSPAASGMNGQCLDLFQ